MKITTAEQANDLIAEARGWILAFDCEFEVPDHHPEVYVAWYDSDGQYIMGYETNECGTPYQQFNPVNDANAALELCGPTWALLKMASEPIGWTVDTGALYVLENDPCHAICSAYLKSEGIEHSWEVPSE
jgi:hypothetical protein